jgi:hypothetical protein
MNLHVYPTRQRLLDRRRARCRLRRRRRSSEIFRRAPPRWNAEIAQQSDLERHPIRLHAVNSVPLAGGGLRVGCSYE